MKGKINNILWNSLDIHGENSIPVSSDLLEYLVELFEKEKKKAVKEALESVRLEYKKEWDKGMTGYGMTLDGYNFAKKELDNKINKILDETTNRNQSKR